MRTAFDVALTERRLATRSGWVRAFGIFFGIAALGLALTAAVSGSAQPLLTFDRTTATLLSLMILFVPLVSLVIGVNALSASRGMWELLVSQPISAFALVAGKWLGAWLSIGGALALGLGTAGLLIAWMIGSGNGAMTFVLMGVSGLLLTASFVAIGCLLGTLVPDRSRALAMSVLVWLVAVFLYDWIIMGFALIGGQGFTVEAVWIGLALNPADLARVVTVGALGAAELLGPAGAVLERSGGWVAPLAWLGLVAWTAVPLWLAGRLAGRVER